MSITHSLTRRRALTGMAALLAGSHASIAGSQIGDFVKAAMATQIGNDRDSAARKHGRMFGGYGYLIRTKNATLPGTAWASGWGGPRTGWYYSSDRMVLVLSSREAWMPDVYELAKDWSAIKIEARARLMYEANDKISLPVVQQSTSASNQILATIWQ